MNKRRKNIKTELAPGPNITSKVLVAKNLAKRYGKRQIIRDISFEFKQGEVVGILGPNGAGKTTCFYMIVGMIPVDGGSIFLDNIDITSMPMYQRARLGIGYLPQETSIFRGMNVEDNILSILQITEPNEFRRKERLEELLEEFSVAHIRKTHALALSGGERRRVEIARAMATDPAFILLDEPFAGVDPIAVNNIMEMVIHLKDKKKIGVIITDHNVRETLAIVNRAYIVYDGNILTSGTKEDIVANKNVREFYLGHKFTF